MTDLLRAWAASLGAGVVLLLAVGALVATDVEGPGSAFLVVPFGAAIVGALAHPLPERDRLGRHLAAALPVPIGLAVADALLLTSRTAQGIADRWLALLLWTVCAVAGVLLVRLVRRSRLPS